MHVEDITPEKFFNHADYAGFWVRFAAACIDMLLYVPFYYGIVLPFGEEHRWWGETAFLAFGLVTYAMFFASKWQGSPGMYIMKFHICTDTGGRVGFVRALFWGITGSIGFALCCAGFFYLQSRFDIPAINDLMKSCKEQNVAIEDCAREVESMTNIPFASFMGLCYASLALALFLLIIWMLSVALPKDKTGFHNLICRTRFIKGRAIPT